MPADAFESGPMTELTDGAAAVRLLDAAGVDAVLLTPDWLDFGPARLEQLVSTARFYLLGANILDSTNQPLCHQFMVRRHGDLEIALTGLWRDSLARPLQAGGVRLAELNLAAARTAALMRQRADIVGALVLGPDSVPALGFDFLVGAPSPDAPGFVLADAVARYDLRIADGTIVAATPVRVNIEGTKPDSLVQAVCDSIDRAVETAGGTIVTRQRGRATADELTRMIINGFLATRTADVWLYDEPLFRTGWDGAAITRRDLVTLLSEPRRLVSCELSGSELKMLTKNPGLKLAFAPGLTTGRLSADSSYRAVATAGLLNRQPRLTARRLTRSNQPLWAIAANVLATEAGRQ